MSNSIIEVNNLSKSYTISHEGRERYTALRDVMAQKAKKIFSFPKSLTSPASTSAFSSKEEFWALKDVNFKIEQGDRVGIIGRNGAGKSTLLKILSRITEPTSGEIKIKGRVASLLEVGTGFHPELTGRENIFLNGAILGMSRAEIKKHFDAIVDFAEVEKFLDTPVKRYSSGMYVRLAFAVAAHLEPEILVVDEVLAVGDAEFQKKCLGKMEDVSKNEGRTIIFVSHNMSAVKILCNRGILLKNGRLITDSTVEEATANYLGNTIEQTIEYLNNVKIYKRDLKISDFKINGKNGGEINLDMEKHIRIELIGQSFHSIQGAVDVTISNLNNEAIIFYSPGHIKNELVHLNDKFYLECEVKLPEDFNGGKYIVKVNFSLPNIETYFETKEPISLVVASKIASNGREFTYQNSAYILIS